jgi:hypothetical protein
MRPTKNISSFSWILLVVAGIVGYLSWYELTHASVVVEWNTASEMDMAGFNLYRSTLQEGPFELVNDQLIPPSTDPLTGGAYHYTDEGLEAGKVYYYRLEAVETGGSVEQFGPIEVRSTSWGKIGIALALVTAAVGITFILKSGSSPRGANGE